MNPKSGYRFSEKIVLNEEIMRRIIAALLFAVVAAPATAQSVEERLPVCLACHGQNGQSQSPGVPSLGAQQTFYVTVQLLMFREHMRVADPMNDMAKGLSDDDLSKFAEIIAKLPAPRPPEGSVDAAHPGGGDAEPLQYLPHRHFCRPG
jgi:cytochrome c553